MGDSDSGGKERQNDSNEDTEFVWYTAHCTVCSLLISWHRWHYGRSRYARSVIA